MVNKARLLLYKTPGGPDKHQERGDVVRDSARVPEHMSPQPR